MGKKVKKVLIGFGLLLTLFLVWIFRPYQKADMADVIPELQTERGPFRVLGSIYTLDGGTIGIWIEDRDGEKIWFSLPAPLGEEDDQYERLFVGAHHYTEEGAREIENSDETKTRLAEILRNSAVSDRYIDVAIAKMTGRWSDYWRLISRTYITKRY